MTKAKAEMHYIMNTSYPDTDMRIEKETEIHIRPHCQKRSEAQKILRRLIIDYRRRAQSWLLRGGGSVGEVKEGSSGND